MKTEKEKKIIVLTGGGTAGHVYPALAVKENLSDEYEVHYIGVKEKDIIYHEIEAVKLHRKLTLKNLLIPVKLVKAISRCKKILKQLNPNLVFSKGGFVALPVVIAAKSLNIPVVSHESDLSMGLANKIILRYCNYMATAFEKTAQVNKKCVYTGQPIRKQILNGNKNNLSFLDTLDKKKKNLLVVGGSSGAKFLNEKIEKDLNLITKEFNVIHITGKGNIKNIDKKCYKQIEYAINIGDYLNLADIVVSRAGSGAINEFLALKKPMLLVPLSKKCSRGDQIENAKLFKSLGLCEMIEEEEYTSQKLMEKLDKLNKNDKIFIKNMQKIKNFDACDKIIELIKKVERN